MRSKDHKVVYNQTLVTIVVEYASVVSVLYKLSPVYIELLVITLQVSPFQYNNIVTRCKAFCLPGLHVRFDRTF